ncbi:unnamed protein product, partial [Mesorhabditis spiculigera]
MPPNFTQPNWTEPYRGILITLVEQKGIDCAPTEPSQQANQLQKNMLHFRSIVEMFVSMMPGLNDVAVLEKWAWMCEMHYRSQIVAKATGLMRWRFANAMSKIPYQNNSFLHIMSEDRFDELCVKFTTTAQDDIMRNEYRGILAEIGKSNEANFLAAHPQVPQLPGGSQAKAKLLDDPSTSDNGKKTARTSFVQFQAKPGQYEPTVREALNAKMLSAKNLPDPEALDFENLCMGSKARENGGIWKREMVGTLVEEMKNNPPIWEDPSQYSLRPLCDKLKSEHRATWITEDDCRRQIDEMRMVVDKLSRKRQLQIAPEVLNFYMALQQVPRTSLPKPPVTTIVNTTTPTPPTPIAATPTTVQAEPSTSTALFELAGAFAAATKAPDSALTNGLGDPAAKRVKYPVTASVPAPDATVAHWLSIVSQQLEAAAQRNNGHLPTPTVPQMPISINGHENVWVPPREDELNKPKPTVSTVSATATAAVMVKPLEAPALHNIGIQNIVTELRNRRTSPPAAATATGSGAATNAKFPAHQQPSSPALTTTVRPEMGSQFETDKWSLLGQLMAHHARELERAKGTGIALKFQKDVTELIAKYHENP